MKYILKTLVFCLLFYGRQVSAQIVPDTISPANAVKKLTGKGVNITNISFTGHPSQIGSFTFPNNTSISFPFDKGIMLSTGDIANTDKPKTGNSRPVETTFGRAGDADLNRLSNQLTNFNTRDAAVLEFDFITLKDSIEFEFCFGSNEYPEFTTQNYYDVFALLLKGPGIPWDQSSGGNVFYTDSFKNLAVINGSTPISVSTINASTNSSYYVDAQTTNAVQFDAFTIKIKVKIAVQCGKKYHLKFAIADVKDDAYDSWIFFKEGSLAGNGDVSDIIADTITQCSNVPVHLSIAGSNSYQYLWNNEVPGKNYTVYPQFTGQEYTCKITDPSTGCSITKKYFVGKIYDSNNTNPFTKGIADTFVYEAFVRAEHQICFDVTGYDNQANEMLTMGWSNDIPGSSFTGDLQEKKNPKRTFCWTPGKSDVGEHKFKVYLRDDNPCKPGKDTTTFTINVICADCKEMLYLENRYKDTTASTSIRRLLPVEQAAKGIIAGTSVDPTQTDGPVIVGKGDTVAFYAGRFIELRPGFEVEDSAVFIAEIKPVCMNALTCDSCCRNNTNGAHFTHVPNIFTPGGDGINDVWQILDVEHPYCAYNINWFRLSVYNRWGILLYEKKQGDVNMCCQFRSLSDVNDNSMVSSISWDGSFNRGGVGSSHACCGNTYYVLLEYKSCQSDETQYLSLVVTAFAPMMVQPLKDENEQSSNQPNMKNHALLEDKQQQQPYNNDKPIAYHLYPNPNNGQFVIFIEGWKNGIESSNISIIDAHGRLIHSRVLETPLNTLDLNYLPSGVYTVKIQRGSQTEFRNVIVDK